MSCGLELIRADTFEEFLALEEDLKSCHAIRVGRYQDLEAFHAAAEELLHAGLSPDDNYYRDPETGRETFSLWYYLPERARGCRGLGML